MLLRINDELGIVRSNADLFVTSSSSTVGIDDLIVTERLLAPAQSARLI